MEFKKLKMIQIVLMLLTALIVVSFLIEKLTQKGTVTSIQPVAAIPTNDVINPIETPKPEILDDDDQEFKKMREQIEKEREDQRRIKALKMQREETDLEFAEQKALLALNKLKRDSIGVVNEGSLANDPNMDIKIVYLGGTGELKEAILSINGINYFVKDKDRPIKNVEVQSITNNGVKIHFLTPGNTTTTYQFKSE